MSLELSEGLASGTNVRGIVGYVKSLIKEQIKQAFRDVIISLPSMVPVSVRPQTV